MDVLWTLISLGSSLPTLFAAIIIGKQHCHHRDEHHADRRHRHQQHQRHEQHHRRLRRRCTSPRHHLNGAHWITCLEGSESALPLDIGTCQILYGRPIEAALSEPGTLTSVGCRCRTGRPRKDEKEDSMRSRLLTGTKETAQAFGRWCERAENICIVTA